MRFFLLAFAQLDDGPARCLDLFSGVDRKTVSVYGELLGQIAGGEDLDRLPQTAEDTLFLQELGSDLSVFVEALEDGQVHCLVLYAEGVRKAAAEGELLEEPCLAALEETAGLVARSRLLTLQATPGKGTLAGGVAAADAFAGMPRPRWGFQLVGLHQSWGISVTSTR